MAPLKKIQNLWRHFLDGPGWLALPDGLTIKRFHYRSSSMMLMIWCYALYDRIFSLPGRILVFIYLIAGFYSSIIFNSPATAIFLALTAIFFIDFFFSCFFYVKGEASRELPERIRSGNIFKVRYKITNKRAMPAYDLRVDPYFRFNGLFRCECMPIIHIAPRSCETFEISCIAKKRGIHRVGSLVLESGFPFNIIKFSRSFAESRRSIICHPTCVDIGRIKTISGENIRNHSLTTLPKPGNSMDFHGCREFRYGDTRRKIHWRASAKYGSLVVKEFQEEHRNRASIILDTLLTTKMPKIKSISGVFKLLNTDLHKTDRNFEAAVILAASIADLLIKQGYAIEHFAAGTHIGSTDHSTEGDNITQVLDLFASAQWSLRDPFPAFDSTTINTFTAGGMVFLILLRNDRNAKEFYNNLLMHGANVTVFLVSDDSSLSAPWLRIVPPANLESGELYSL